MISKQILLLVITIALSIVSLPSRSLNCNDSNHCPSVLTEIESLAERKAPEAQLLMGLLFQRGEYFVKDPEKSFLWYKRAAMGKRGFTLAQHLVGRAYLFGDGVEPNMRRAVKYLKRSAKLGLVDSQRLLAQEYFSGKRLEQDLELSKFWFTKASLQNDYHSTVRLAQILRAGENQAEQEESKKLVEASKKMPINIKEVTETIEIGPQLFSSVIQHSNLWLDGKISEKMVCRAADRDRNNHCYTFVNVDNFRKPNYWPRKKSSQKYNNKH
jgi:Sel1 repeat-containing protein